MTLHKFIGRLNWRQVLIHFIATWFFMHAFQTLALLHDTHLLDICRDDGGDVSKIFNDSRISQKEFADFAIWSIAIEFGLIVAFVISLTISIKRKWFWLNSFIVLILICRFKLFGWTYLKDIFWTPGDIFRTTTLYYLTNGIILLALGYLAFFLNSTNKFIAGDNTLTFLKFRKYLQFKNIRFRNLKASLNWRQVLIHSIAAWFFMYSFHMLFLLFDTNLLEPFSHSNYNAIMKAISENKISSIEVCNYYALMNDAITVGLLVAFAISLMISIKLKWFWFNSFIVLILMYILSRLDFLGWTYLKEIFLTPGEIFENATLDYLTNGIILLALGCLTFFLNKINKFIASGNRTKDIQPNTNSV